MPRVRLIHWNAEEAKERAERLRTAEFEVDHELLDGASALRELKKNPPTAVVIDLSRLPMQGRDLGVALRCQKTTSSVPLIFVAGDPEKVARVRQTLPDALYTTWDQVRRVLAEAIANPPAVTAAPRSVLEGYAGAPLAKKLGIKRHASVALVDAPQGFEELFGELPEWVTLRRQAKGPRNLTIWFTRSSQELEDKIERMARLAEQGPLWIVWPKRSSPMGSDLTQALVRKIGLATGLVDYKVCAIDSTWSGLLFTRRDSR
jgi:hypothetical protein